MNNQSSFSAIKKLLSLLNRNQKKRWSVIILLAIFSSILEIFTTSVIIVFSQIISDPTSATKYLSKINLTNITPNRTILYFSIFLGIFYIFKNLCIGFEQYYQSKTLNNFNDYFKNKMMNKLLSNEYIYHISRNSSYSSNIVNHDINQSISVGLSSIASIGSEILIFSSLIGFIIYFNPQLFFVISGVFLLIGVIVYKKVLPIFYKIGLESQYSGVMSGQYLYQLFHGFKEIILSNKQNKFINKCKMHINIVNKNIAKLALFNNLPRLFLESLFVLVFMIMIVTLCLDHKTNLTMIGTIGGYLYIGFRVMPGINRIINYLNNFKTSIISIEKIHEEFNNEVRTAKYYNISDFEFKKSICIKNIEFSYQNTNKLSIDNISFSINKGEQIGIVGETGSGKSTLVDIILGLILPCKGKILVDGKYQVNSNQWHKMLGYVPQSNFLIDDTIEANIAFGEDEIDPIKLENAIDAAQLRKLISILPNKEKTEIGERGIKLSGGERQRIVIARALYHNPEVLIFDEATSALDTKTENKLMETINKISINRTVIMIAHRITTLQNCNKIIHMENGKLKEITTYNALIKSQKEVVN